MLNVHVLDITYNYGNRNESIYPVLLESETELILVDCGYAGFMPLLKQKAAKLGLSFSRLTGILITHHDIGHMGRCTSLSKRIRRQKYIHHNRKLAT